MIKLFKKLFGNKKEDAFSKVPDGYCPNCWGYERYGDLIRDKYYDQQISVNQHDASHQYSFIQEYVVTHLKGIKLHDSIHGTVCPTCRTAFTKK